MLQPWNSVKELRLLGISDIDSANAYLPEFRQDFNRRFAVAPRSNHPWRQFGHHLNGKPIQETTPHGAD